MNHRMGRRGFLKMAAAVLAALGMSKTQAATAAPKASGVLEEAGIPTEGVLDGVEIIPHSHSYDGGTVTMIAWPSPLPEITDEMCEQWDTELKDVTENFIAWLEARQANAL